MHGFIKDLRDTKRLRIYLSFKQREYLQTFFKTISVSTSYAFSVNESRGIHYTPQLVHFKDTVTSYMHVSQL